MISDLLSNSGSRGLLSLTFCLFISICVCYDASAQRTADGQYYFDIGASSSVTPVPSLGGSVHAGQYLLSSRWEGGVNFLLKKDGTRYFPVYADFSYLFRLCGSSTRSVSLYAGLGALMGAEITTPEEMAPDTGYGDAGGGGLDIDFDEVGAAQAASPQVAFIYGLMPVVEAEFFLFRRVAFFTSLRMPLTFRSSHQAFNLTGNIGIRFNL